MLPRPVTALIPQRPPFVMIDALTESSARSASSSFMLLTDNILMEGGKFTESGLIENIAQTAAAGLRDYDGLTAPAAIGYIGSIKNLIIIRLPETGETIITQVRFLQEIMGVKIVHGIIKIGNETIAACELGIYLQQ